MSNTVTSLPSTGAQNPQPVHQTSTFKEAVPYAVLALGVGTVGAISAVACSVIALKVVGIVTAVIGSYAFFGVLLCGIEHQGNPEAFKGDLGKFVTTFIGAGIANLIQQVAFALIDSLLHPNRSVIIH